MRHQLAVIGAGVIVTALGATVAFMSRPTPRHAIAVEPIVAHPSVVIDTPATPATPGMGKPPEESVDRGSRAAVRRKLEKQDPWTGEDLRPRLELAAQARSHLEFDRQDPFDPSRTYPPGATNRTSLDRDPWAANDADER